MSVNSVQSQIVSVQREIESLVRRQSEKKRGIAVDASRIASIRRLSIARTSPTVLKSRLREMERIEAHAASLQRDDADLQKKIAAKTEALHRLQRDLFREQDREQKNLLGAIERQAQADRLASRRALLDVATVPTTRLSAEYDAFISHASEDKVDLVRPLAEILKVAGRNIWYDEFQLTIGDSLRRSIDHGLSRSRFGIVVLSPAFFAKNWPQYELDGLVAKETMGGKVILPIWHKVSKDEVLKYSPTLADRVALNTATVTVQELAARLNEAMTAT